MTNAGDNGVDSGGCVGGGDGRNDGNGIEGVSEFTEVHISPAGGDVIYVERGSGRSNQKRKSGGDATLNQSVSRSNLLLEVESLPTASKFIHMTISRKCQRELSLLQSGFDTSPVFLLEQHPNLTTQTRSANFVNKELRNIPTDREVFWWQRRSESKNSYSIISTSVTSYDLQPNFTAQAKVIGKKTSPRQWQWGTTEFKPTDVELLRKCIFKGVLKFEGVRAYDGPEGGHQMKQGTKDAYAKRQIAYSSIIDGKEQKFLENQDLVAVLKRMTGQDHVTQCGYLETTEPGLPQELHLDISKKKSLANETVVWNINISKDRNSYLRIGAQIIGMEPGCGTAFNARLAHSGNI